MAQRKQGVVRARRTFSAEFKLEAVQRATERRAAGVPLTQVARELDVTPDLLRAWARQITARHGARSTDVFPGHGQLPSDAAEVRRLEREVRRLPVELMDRITVNPQQCGGRPCVRGMRIRVIDVLDLLATGLTPDRVVEELPDLEPANVTACLRFASRRLDHPILAVLAPGWPARHSRFGLTHSSRLHSRVGW